MHRSIREWLVEHWSGVQALEGSLTNPTPISPVDGLVIGCSDNSFPTRSSAMWLATNWSEVTADLDAGLTHPVNIQEWHREQKTTEALLVSPRGSPPRQGTRIR